MNLILLRLNVFTLRFFAFYVPGRWEQLLGQVEAQRFWFTVQGSLCVKAWVLSSLPKGITWLQPLASGGLGGLSHVFTLTI